jgi:hypothetical protein
MSSVRDMVGADMFQYLWPEENVCECCNNTNNGAMRYISNEPVYFVCKDCSPEAHKVAMKFAIMNARKEYTLAEQYLNC